MQLIETFSTSKLNTMKEIMLILTAQNSCVKLSQQFQISVLINNASFFILVFNIVVTSFTSAQQ